MFKSGHTFRPPQTSRGHLHPPPRLLPGPVGAAFSPLLVGARGRDLVRRMVFLVTDQIWTMDLAIFLNDCHSTRANSSLLPSIGSLTFALSLFFFFFWAISSKSKKPGRSKNASTLLKWLRAQLTRGWGGPDESHVLERGAEEMCGRRAGTEAGTCFS